MLIRYGLATVMLIGFAVEGGADQEKSARLHQRIEQLIQYLNDEDFKVRESAQQELLKIGPPVLEALGKATQSQSLEVRSRAKRIIAQIDFDLNREALYVMNLNGVRTGQILVAGQDQYGSPHWSPSGERIAFDAWPENPRRYLMSHVFTIKPDGSGPLDLGPGAMPSWSPDGQQLTVHRYGAEGGIWVMNADGTKAKRIHPSGTNPRWSPHGRSIAFVSRTIAIYEVAQERIVRTVPRRKFRSISIGINWSPDGKQLSFSGVPEGGALGLYTVAADGSRDAAPIRVDEQIYLQSSWSPDGKQLAFSTSTKDRPTKQIYTLEMHPETGSHAPMWLKGQDETRRNSSPAWSPDGRQIIFSSRPLAKRK